MAARGPHTVQLREQRLIQYLRAHRNILKQNRLRRGNVLRMPQRVGVSELTFGNPDISVRSLRKPAITSTQALLL